MSTQWRIRLCWWYLRASGRWRYCCRCCWRRSCLRRWRWRCSCSTCLGRTSRWLSLWWIVRFCRLLGATFLSCSFHLELFVHTGSLHRGSCQGGGIFRVASAPNPFVIVHSQRPVEDVLDVARRFGNVFSLLLFGESNSAIKTVCESAGTARYFLV